MYHRLFFRPRPHAKGKQVGIESWKRGYYAESGYVHGFYRELCPSVLAWSALLVGVAAPLERFRYIDLGCGQGFGLALLAACHPDSEFVGIDFMPEHVAHGRQLAAQAGLDNLRFIEGDFAELARDPAAVAALADASFDYVVSHGICSWVSAEVRQSVWALGSRLLTPGGLMYASYNTLPGWLPSLPLQHLVRLQQQGGRSGGDALRQATDLMDKLVAAKSPFTLTNPGVAARVKLMREQDSAYLVQEYNNQHWQPQFCSAMMQEAAAHKLRHIASAQFTEMFDALLPAPLRELLAAQGDALMREQLRDIATNQSFRRDIYVKGQLRMWPRRHIEAVKSVRLTALAGAPLPATGENFSFHSYLGPISGARDAYAGLVEGCARGASVGDLLGAGGSTELGSLLERLSLLLMGGWLNFEHARVPTDAARRLNRAIFAAVSDGAPYRHVAVPFWACAQKLENLDMMCAHIWSGKRDHLPSEAARSPRADDLLPDLARQLAQAGQRLNRDGRMLTEPADIETELRAQTHGFGATWDKLRAVGAV